MKKSILLLVFVLICGKIFSQIDPLNSPYSQNGQYSVVMDSVMNSQPTDMLIFRPSSSTGGPFPTLLFQPGANGTGTSYINKHSYDIYWSHLASYGFVIFIINNTSGGPNSTLFTTAHDWIKTNTNNTSSWMNSYVDLGRFIVSGHSNGGMNATDIIINRPSEIKGIIYMASYPNPGMLGFGAQNVGSYNGKVLFLNGSEDDTSAPLVGTTNSVSLTAYSNRFTTVSCKSRVLFSGIGHGGFGDYNNPSQPVGTIGRASATASVRHYLVSFLLSQFKFDQVAFNGFNSTLLRPTSVGEYDNSCSVVTGENMNSMESKESFTLFPNPARNNIQLSFVNNQTGTIKVYNSIGSKVYELNVENESQVILNISSIPSGIYIMNFEGTDGIVYSHKFLID